MNYFVEPLTAEKVRSLAQKTGLRPFEMLRKGDKAVKEGGITAETPDDVVIQLIVNEPNALQRPIVEVGDHAVMARPIDKALDLVRGRPQ